MGRETQIGALVAMPPIFFIIRNKFVNPRPQPVKENGAGGFGNAGCEYAIKFAMFCKAQRQTLAFLILMCSNNNDLEKYVRRASKYIPRDRIFACHISLQRGGNGKSLAVGVANFPNWRGAVERIVPKFTQVVNRQGAYNFFAFTSTGGSGSPALVYFNHLTDKMKMFEQKMITVVEARDEFSVENQDEIIMRLCRIQNARIVLAQNQEEEPTHAEIVDYSFCGQVGAIATQTYKHDPSDYLLRFAKLTAWRGGLNTVPYFSRMIFWQEQHFENTRDTIVNLYRAVGVKKGDWCITLGDVRPDIVKLASEIVQPQKGERARHDLKVSGVKLGEWNVIFGRFRLHIPKVVPTTNFDLLDNMMREDDEE